MALNPAITITAKFFDDREDGIKMLAEYLKRDDNEHTLCNYCGHDGPQVTCQQCLVVSHCGEERCLQTHLKLHSSHCVHLAHYRQRFKDTNVPKLYEALHMLRQSHFED
jgi:hypothetical protein